MRIFSTSDNYKAVYEIEQEFFPYISVNFDKAINCNKQQIIIKIEDETVVTDKVTVDELRPLIKELLLKYKRISELPRSTVVQGWQAKKRELNKHSCCKPDLNPNKYNLNDEVPAYYIKHWVYRDPTTPNINKNNCKQIRYEECKNNYPQSTFDYDRCVREVDWLCTKGYDLNQKRHDYIKSVQNKLGVNNYFVNKRLFDQSRDSGLFEDFKAVTEFDNEYMPTLTKLWYKHNIFWIILLVLTALIISKTD